MSSGTGLSVVSTSAVKIKGHEDQSDYSAAQRKPLCEFDDSWFYCKLLFLVKEGLFFHHILRIDKAVE